MKHAFLLLLIATLLIIPVVTADSTPRSTPSSTVVNEKNSTLNVTPSQINFSIPPGGSSESNISVSAEDGNIGLNVTLNTTGDIKDWISLENTSINLSPGEAQTVNFNVTAPSNASGIYYGGINATSNDQNNFVNITVNVSENLGRINVTVNDIFEYIPSAAIQVWENSYPKQSGFTDINGNWLSDWLSPGVYLVEVSKGGYITKKQNATVIAGETAQVLITLQFSGGPILDVTPYSISESAYTGDTVTRILTIMNIGDMLLDNINITSNSSWITFDTAFIDSINNGSYEYVYAYLGPISTAGTYYGNISVTSGNGGNETIPIVFQVSSRPTVGGPSIISIPGEPVIEYKIEIDLPVEYEIYAGIKETIVVKVKNLEADVHNLTLDIIGMSPEQFSITPALIETFYSGEEIIFLVNINATDSGIYTLLFKAITAETAAYKDMILKVKPQIEIPGRAECSRGIENLRNITDILWIEATNLGLRGENVTQILSLLSEARHDLDKAMESLLSENYTVCIDYVESAREKLESVVELIAKIKSRAREICPITGIAFLNICMIWWIIIIVLIIIIIILAYSWRRVKKALKRTKNWFELYKIRDELLGRKQAY